MLHRSWMRTALQKSEAVLMPALMREEKGASLRWGGKTERAEDPNIFLPMGAEPTTALSTYVRPRGSMAGRSVLRAAGMLENTAMRVGKPRYYQKRVNQRVNMTGWRGRR